MPKFLIKFRDGAKDQEIEADDFKQTADGKQYRFWKRTATTSMTIAMIPTEVVRIVERVEG